jgi:hypothetical protein
MGDRPGSPSWVRTSEDKVRKKDLCGSVRAVYILEKLSDVSGLSLRGGTLQNCIGADSRGFTGACVAVAQAWYA